MTENSAKKPTHKSGTANNSISNNKISFNKKAIDLSNINSINTTINTSNHNVISNRYNTQTKSKQAYGSLSIASKKDAMKISITNSSILTSKSKDVKDIVKVTNELPLFKEESDNPAMNNIVISNNINQTTNNKLKIFAISNNKKIESKATDPLNKTRVSNPRQNKRINSQNKSNIAVQEVKNLPKEYAQSVIVNSRKKSTFATEVKIKDINNDSNNNLFLDILNQFKDIIIQVTSKVDLMLYTSQIDNDNIDKYILDQVLTLNGVCFDIDNAEESISILMGKIEESKEILSENEKTFDDIEVRNESSKRVNKYLSLFESCRKNLADIVEILEKNSNIVNSKESLIEVKSNKTKTHKYSSSTSTMPYIMQSNIVTIDGKQRDKKVKFDSTTKNTLIVEKEEKCNEAMKSSRTVNSESTENEKIKKKKKKEKIIVKHIQPEMKEKEEDECDLDLSINNENIKINKVICSEPKHNQDIFIRKFFEEVVEVNKFINITNNSFDKYEVESSSSDLSLNDNEKLYYLNLHKNKLDSKVFKSKKLCNIKRSKSVLNIEGFGSKAKINKVNEPNSNKQISKSKFNIKESSIKRKVSDKDGRLISKRISGIKLIDDINLLSDTEEDEEISYDKNMALTLNKLNEKTSLKPSEDKEVKEEVLKENNNCIIF